MALLTKRTLNPLCRRREVFSYSQRNYSHKKPILVTKRGVDLLNDPIYNKGTGWPLAERDRLGLRGLVPPMCTTMDEQKKRVLIRLTQSDPLEQHNYLASLQDRNETLFYSILADNIETLAPVVYTPTVGEVCKNFSSLYRRARGMYFSFADRGHMDAMTYNWPEPNVEVIVVTDGSRVLGLGDLGVQGMGIPIGKTSLYVVGGGINPQNTLPITLDVGTNNEELLNLPLYLGLKQKRISGKPFYDFVDEFISAVTNRWPDVLIQFEDFSTENAYPLLEKYRKKNLVINDDIQGTGAVATAGILGALRVRSGDEINVLSQENEKIIVVGAGSAGIGVANSIAYTIMTELDLRPEEVYKKFYVFDAWGLLAHQKSESTDSPQNSRPPISLSQAPFVRTDLKSGMSLIDVVKEIKPTILLGLSGVGGIFTEEVVKEMYKHCPRPIIFPMSNPTPNSECTAEQAYNWTDGNAIFASGSPFNPVTLPNGRVCLPSQANNMFIYPGLGLAATKLKMKRISYGMLNKAAIALSKSLSKEEISKGVVYPSIKRIRQVGLDVANTVAEHGCVLGLNKVPKPSNIRLFLEQAMWDPNQYAPLVEVREH